MDPALSNPAYSRIFLLYANVSVSDAMREGITGFYRPMN